MNRLLVVLFILILALFLLFYKNPCEKPYVTFTFDDGYTDQFNTLPIFQKYNEVAVVFVPTGLVGQEFENHSLMNWQQLAQLKNAGWDIESHGVSHVNFTEINNDQLVSELIESKKILKENGYDATIIAIPHGNYNNEIKQAVTRYYKAARPSWWGFNSFKTLDRYDLKSVWMFNDTSLEEMKSWIDETAKNNYWTIIQVHLVREDLSWRYTISPSNLEHLVAYIKSKNLEVKTISKVLDMHCDSHG